MVLEEVGELLPHHTRSPYAEWGSTNSPLGGDGGLTPAGRQFVGCVTGRGFW